MGITSHRYNLMTGKVTLTDFLAVVRDKDTTTILGEERADDKRVYFREVLDRNTGQTISKDTFGVWNSDDWVYSGLTLGVYALFASKRFFESRAFQQVLTQAYEQGGRQGLADFFSHD